VTERKGTSVQGAPTCERKKVGLMYASQCREHSVLEWQSLDHCEHHRIWIMSWILNVDLPEWISGRDCLLLLCAFLKYLKWSEDYESMWPTTFFGKHRRLLPVFASFYRQALLTKKISIIHCCINSRLIAHMLLSRKIFQNERESALSLGLAIQCTENKGPLFSSKRPSGAEPHSEESSREIRM
jgi:hypothetical protein